MNFRVIFGAQPAVKRDFSDKQRTDLAKEGKAMPDGSFPIVTAKDLANAVKAYGRADDPEAVKKHIIARAKDLGLTDELPDDWKPAKSKKGELTVVLKEADEPDPNRVMVVAEVYAPDIPDSDGEFMTAEEIQKMAHEFLRKGRQDQIDVQHDGNVVDGVCMVESFIARKGDPDFHEGAWVAAVDVNNAELAQKIRKGDINGFSMEAMVSKEPERHVQMDIPPVVTGHTSKNEDHTHDYFVEYDVNGQLAGGFTSPGPDGHIHMIKRGTATEKSAGHNHRYDATVGVKLVPIDGE